MTVPWIGASVIISTLLATRTAAGWRWIYYIALIYSSVSIIGIFIFYFPPSRPQRDYEKTRWEQLKEQDYIGIFLYSTGLTAFLIGISWGGTEGHPWNGASTLAPIIAGGLVFLSAFAYDFTMAKNPFFPWFLFRQVGDFSILLVIIFVTGAVYFALAALLPQATLYIFSNDPIEIGLIQLPNGLGQLVFGGLASLLIGKIKHLKAQVIVLMAMQTLFAGLLSITVPGNKAAWMAFQVFAMGAFPLITVLSIVITSLNVSIKHLGLASGLIGTFRSLGGAAGTAILNTVVNGQLSKQLPKRIGKAAVAQGLDESILPALITATVNNAVGVPQAFSLLPNITTADQAALSQALKEAYAYSFRRVFWATIPFGVFALVCSFFLNDPSKYLTNHVATHMERDGLFQARQKTDHSDATEKGAAVPNDDSKLK